MSYLNGRVVLFINKTNAKTMNRTIKTRLLWLALSLISIHFTAKAGTLYSTASGSWGGLIWASSPSGAATIAAPDDRTQSIVIQTGHTVTLNASEKAVLNLTVENGATLKVGGSTTRYIEIYGNALLNGTVGGSSDGLSFDINGSSCTISGIGNTQLKRLRKDNDPGAASTTNLVIDKDIKLTFTTSSSAALYNNGAPNSTFNVTVADGKKLTVSKSDVSIDGIDGSNSINLAGTFTINGTLDIQQGDLWLATDNTSGEDIEYQLGKNGHLLVTGKIYGNAGMAGAAQAKLTGSGKLTLKSSGHIFQQLHSSRNSILFQTGANVIFSSTGNQNIPSSITYQHLTVRGGGNKSLLGDTDINGTLFLEGGFVRLGSHDLVISSGGNVVGGSTLSYVKTDDGGSLRRSVRSSIVYFPVGNSSYNPVRLFNTFAATQDWYAISVKDEVLENGTQGLPLSSEVVDRTWIISEDTPGGSDLNLQLQWSSSDELPGFDQQQCFISQWKNGEWQSNSPQAASGNSTLTLTEDGINTVSSFRVQSNSVLPIDLAYFQGKAIEAGIQLEWETLLEENNDFIAIERSRDGQHFEEIGRMEGKGSTDQAQLYHFIDRTPLVGLNYYRLRQVDFDGTFEYHDIISVHWHASENAIKVFPTITRDYLHLQWAAPLESETNLRIISTLGRVVQEVKVPSEISEWSLSTVQLEQGYYILQIPGPSELRNIRFLKRG